MSFFINLFGHKKKAPVWQLEEGHKVEPAFVSDNVQYYYIKDTFNTFCSRALDAMSVYEKFSMRCNREYLVELEAAMNRILSNPSTINIQELVQLRMNLKERLDFALPPDEIIWELAAVMFFDPSESPYRYDPEYGKVKIARWKEDHTIGSFFLTIPIGTLVPLPDLSKVDLEGYLSVIQKISEAQLHSLSSLGLSGQQNKDSYSGANSQRSSASTSTDAPLSSTSSYARNTADDTHP